MPSRCQDGGLYHSLQLEPAAMEEAVQRADQWKSSRSEHALCRYLDTPYFRGSFLGSS